MRSYHGPRGKHSIQMDLSDLSSLRSSRSVSRSLSLQSDWTGLKLLWHPANPVVPFEIAAGYVVPPGPLKRDGSEGFQTSLEPGRLTTDRLCRHAAPYRPCRDRRGTPPPNQVCQCRACLGPPAERPYVTQFQATSDILDEPPISRRPVSAFVFPGGCIHRLSA